MQTRNELRADRITISLSYAVIAGLCGVFLLVVSVHMFSWVFGNDHRVVEFVCVLFIGLLYVFACTVCVILNSVSKPETEDVENDLEISVYIPRAKQQR